MTELARICKDQLEEIEVISCKGVSDPGAKRLAKLTKLKSIHLENLQSVRDPKGVLDHLKSRLPNCHVTYPPFTNDSNDGSDEDQVT